MNEINNHAINEKINNLNSHNKKNEILMIIEIEKKDINKNIYFLDNTDFFDEEKKLNHFHDNLPELNKSNVDLFINNEKYEFKKYFIPKTEGVYTIKLQINIYIKNCSYMFYECINLINIDLSSFDTKNVNNMYSMFSYCYLLKNINLDSFETKNVTDMGYMFSNCENLINLDLSIFNIQNVVDMRYMFSSCYKLKYIDLSNFIPRNKANINGMFFPCSNLGKLKIKKEFYEIIKSEINFNIEIIFT